MTKEQKPKLFIKNILTKTGLTFVQKKRKVSYKVKLFIQHPLIHKKEKFKSIVKLIYNTLFLITEKYSKTL